LRSIFSQEQFPSSPCSLFLKSPNRSPGAFSSREVSLQVNRGDRIGLVGPNSAGKSTLFSLILDEASPDAGKVSLEKNATLGYLPQETAAAGEESVLELACGKSHQALEDEHDWEIESRAKRILAGLGFRESDFNRPARALSGGWIMRAHLPDCWSRSPISCCSTTRRCCRATNGNRRRSLRSHRAAGRSGRTARCMTGLRAGHGGAAHFGYGMIPRAVAWLRERGLLVTVRG
jgi:hypothetical protein